MLARPLARHVVLSHCLLPSTLVVVCLGQVTDLTGIGAHLRANRCGARLVKTVNACQGKRQSSVCWFGLARNELFFSKNLACCAPGVVVMAQCTVGRNVLAAAWIPHQV